MTRNCRKGRRVTEFAEIKGCETYVIGLSDGNEI